ncbi:MAG: hypothetical protein O2780_09000 [Proteobacteria bacterium]|nr:hypothetical protein [Pseudomonadota bacterium]
MPTTATLQAFTECPIPNRAVRETSRHDGGMPDPGTLMAFMEVLAARCAVRKTSRHDNGVTDPGTLRAFMEPAADTLWCAILPGATTACRARGRSWF